MSENHDKTEIITTRGPLSEKQWEEILDKIPVKIREIDDKMMDLDIDRLAFRGSAYGWLQEAIVCLKDASDTSNMALYSLQEAYAHLEWYRNHDQIENARIKGFFWAKFHIDNAILRLYPAAEDLAEFVMIFMKIDKKKIDGYRNISKASKIGKYLASNCPNDPITVLLRQLINDENWKETREYRNKWVHEQPPSCNGMGIVYNRGKRWANFGSGGKMYSLGAGDKPDWKIDDLISTVTKAMDALAHTLEGLYNMVLSEYQSLCKDT
jgi:hypothetical protein